MIPRAHSTVHQQTESTVTAHSGNNNNAEAQARRKEDQWFARLHQELETTAANRRTALDHVARGTVPCVQFDTSKPCVRQVAANTEDVASVRAELDDTLEAARTRLYEEHIASRRKRSTQCSKKNTPKKSASRRFADAVGKSVRFCGIACPHPSNIMHWRRAYISVHTRRLAPSEKKLAKGKDDPYASLKVDLARAQCAADDADSVLLTTQTRHCSL